MTNGLIFSLSALAALLPAAILPFRRALDRPDLVFWSLFAVALAGAVTYCAVAVETVWTTSFAVTLWVSIAATLLLYGITVAFSPVAIRLSALLIPYLVLLAALAVLFAAGTPDAPVAVTPGPWLSLHIVLSVLSYALITLAAVAGVAVFVQERSLKRKTDIPLGLRLPAIADSEQLQLRWLWAAEGVLGLSIISGIAQMYVSRGEWLALDHKTILAVLAFVVIGVLLVLHLKSGLRGRRAARLLLIAYLLLSLAYPGVKFVTDILLAGA